jgi:phospholipid N-methyltransferase
VRLEQRILRLAELRSARCVVELGPGTGGTTRALLAALPPQARLLAIELNAELAQRLQARLRDPRLIVHHGSALALAETLARWRLPAPDAVVSGIPFSILPAEVAQGIGAVIRDRLTPGGRFVAYQFRDHVAGYLSPLLGAPKREWEWFNVPPVRVFRWVKAPSSDSGDTGGRH